MTPTFPLPSSHKACCVSSLQASHSPLGGCSIANLLHKLCPQLIAPYGVVFEYLDPQAGSWQRSLDGGLSWQGIRTDLIHRPNSLGLVLSLDARLRVLPYTGSAHHQARLVLHAAACLPGPLNGCYRPYALDEHHAPGSSVILTSGLATINGTPRSTGPQRLRNKRALAALEGH